MRVTLQNACNPSDSNKAIDKTAIMLGPVTPDQRTLNPLPEAHWYVAYVVARHEKVVAQELVRRSVESFLPLHRTVHYWKNRRANVELPLFPSYLFVRISALQRLRVLEVPSVVHIVTFNSLPAEVPDDEIQTLRTALQLRRAEPCPYLAAGKRIRIMAGPLQGLEGMVIRQNSETRIIVSIDFIQRSTSVELHPEDLQCLPEMTSTWKNPRHHSYCP